MKTWLFATLEASIAVAGLAAYFWADNTVLAGVAAALAAGLGVAQPIIAARTSRRMQRYHEEMFDSSVDAVDEQIAQLENELIDVPFPHRHTVAAVLRSQFPDDANNLLAQYVRVVKAIEAKSFAAEELTAALADKLSGHPLVTHLQGKAALAQDSHADAHRYFTAVCAQCPTWISPWLGWAASAWELGAIEEISQQHPHVNAVELTPYDVGDEQTFIDLTEEQRDALVEQFQATAQALGAFYTMAEFTRSKGQIEESRQRLRKAA